MNTSPPSRRPPRDLSSRLGFLRWSDALVRERFAAFDKLDPCDDTFVACTGDAGHPDAVDMDTVAHDGAVAVQGVVGEGWSIHAAVTGLEKAHRERRSVSW